MSYQKIVIVGNLGKDPEVRFTQGGMAIANMSVAVSEKIKDGDQWKEHSEWFRCVLFGKTAENAGQYLKKGKKALVEGRIRQRTYDDKDGTKKYITELLADRVVFLSSKGEGDDAQPERQAQRSAQRARGEPQASTTPAEEEEMFDDDLLAF